MHLGEKLAALRERIGENVEICERKRCFWIIPYTERRGWLSIEDRSDHWAVLWTSSRDTHDPLFCGPAIGIDVRKDTGARQRRTGLSGSWRTALTLWPVRNEDEAEQVFCRVSHLVDLAYAFHVTQPWMSKPDLIPNVRG